MCKHCARIVEDVQYKQLVHDFMAACAEQITKRSALTRNIQAVTADDLELNITVNAQFRGVHDILREMWK